MKMHKKIIFAGLLLTLSGCGGSSFLKSSEPAQTIYSLRSAPPSAEGQTGRARTVEIAKVSIPPGFETDRIALYSQQGHRLDYFSGAKWPDILDDVLQDFTRRTATATLPYVVAVTPSQAIDSDFRLQTKINEFQPVYAGDTTSTPDLVVSIEFTLLKLPEEKIISSFTLSKTERSSSNKLDSITAGMEEILQVLENEAFHRLDFYLNAQLDTKPKHPGNKG